MSSNSGSEEQPLNRRHLHYKAWSFYAVQYLLGGLVVYWIYSRFPLISMFLTGLACIGFYRVWQQSLAPRYHSRVTREILEPLARHHHGTATAAAVK
jgi:hypothetical protein